MILQALKEYYDRKAASATDVAPEGFEKKEFPYLIVINLDGKFIELEDTREKLGKKLIGKSFLVPRSCPRSGKKAYETTFLLWDHLGYVLGHPSSDEKALKQHDVWLNSLRNLPDSLKKEKEVKAILQFYDSGGIEQVKASPNWKDCSKLKSCNITFRLAGVPSPIPCSPFIQNYVQKTESTSRSNGPGSANGLCLVTGEHGEIVRIHSDTRISKDSKKLVGFQKNSGYDSYGKKQGYNAPVSKSAEFAYTTGLNILLKSRKSRMQIGDATVVFWSEKESDLEENFSDIFGEPRKDNPDCGINAVRNLYKSVEIGALVTDEVRTNFYVLGLAPNVARIAVRFWIVDTVAGMAGKIIQHFEDLRIEHRPYERDVLSLFQLFVAIAVQSKSENIPPNLAGETMRAILGGLPYPQTLLQATIRRLRAEPNVTYARASILKAYINRKTRFKNPQIKEELKMSLDTSNTNIGYRLGRLFAVLEKIQAEANPGINATIRERFYGAASGTPVAVFSNLMRLKNHHLAKLENKGRRINFERLIADIMDAIEDFPSHLSLAEQGRFAIGYYHQNQQFYIKKETSED